MAQGQKWKELHREVVYHKYSQTVERRDYQQPNGKVVDYYIHVEPPGTCVLGLTEDNKVITVWEYRPGPDTILRELPGGRIDPGEDLRAAGMRELLEETGYTGEADAWVGTWQADAYAHIDRSIIIAKNCKKIAEPQLEETEFSVLELADMADFVAQVRTGQLTDAAGALLALDHLGLLR